MYRVYTLGLSYKLGLIIGTNIIDIHYGIL